MGKKIIGVLNYKGGTGKTTTVVNLAAGLALRGERVLCIDLDTQSGLAVSFGVQKHTYSLTHLMLGKAEPQDCVISARDNLDLIIGDRELMTVEQALWKIEDKHQAQQLLANKMESLSSNYDYIILDYSPATSRLSENGLFYTDEIIIPVSMDYLALVGTRQVIKSIKTISQYPEHNIHLFMIVPTFYYERLRKDREIMDTLKSHFADKLATPIRANIKLSEAPSYQMTIYEYAPRSHGAIDYAHLVERVVNG